MAMYVKSIPPGLGWPYEELEQLNLKLSFSDQSIDTANITAATATKMFYIPANTLVVALGLYVDSAATTAAESVIEIYGADSDDRLMTIGSEVLNDSTNMPMQWVMKNYTADGGTISLQYSQLLEGFEGDLWMVYRCKSNESDLNVRADTG